MANNNKPVLSPKEIESLALAWQCFETDPKIDMDKFATLTGYTRGSASVTLGNIKRKLKNMQPGGTPKGTTTPKKAPARPRNTPGSSTKKTKHADMASGSDIEVSPSKRPKKNKKDLDNDDDDEFSIPRVKKEELDDLNTTANDFYKQLHNATVEYNAAQ